MKSLRTLLNKNVKIIVFFIVILVLFVVWNTFLRPDEIPVFSNETDQATNSEVGREIVSTLSKLNTVNINTDVLQNDVFNQLRDFSQPLPNNLDVSKSNPFIVGSAIITQPSDTNQSSQINTVSGQDDAVRAGSENDGPAAQPVTNGGALEAEIDTSFDTQTQ